MTKLVRKIDWLVRGHVVTKDKRRCDLFSPIYSRHFFRPVRESSMSVSFSLGDGGPYPKLNRWKRAKNSEEKDEHDISYPRQD